MTMFDYDVMQKKSIASGARHRKCGARSKKCTLPSDFLTPKQKKEMNGAMMEYAMNAPMSWEMFCGMPKDLRGEYIFNLADKYHVSQRKLADMFGVSYGVCTKAIKELGVWPFTRFDKSTAEQDAAWKRFLGNWNAACVKDVPRKPKVEELKAPDSKNAIKSKAGHAKIENGSISFTGKPEDVAKKLVEILGEGGEYSISVTFSLC